jgi:hypothetical protein
MGSHPINLAIRFLLEIAALVSMAYWGWGQGEGALRFVYAFGIPLLAAMVWGIFAVPDDPSRSGNAPVPVPGLIRLILELLFFALAAWMLFNRGASTSGALFSMIVILHYLASYDRILWLLGIPKGNL